MVATVERSFRLLRSPACAATAASTASAKPSGSAIISDWAAMDRDARRRVLGTIFERMIVGPDRDFELVPREGWKPYLRAAIQTAHLLPAELHERKTEVKDAEVITAQLVQDERGWLRLAG
jgi:hypothetical protein